MTREEYPELARVYIAQMRRERLRGMIFAAFCLACGLALMGKLIYDLWTGWGR